MALEGIVASDPNLALAAKLMDAAHIQQKVNAENMANWMVPGAKEVAISSSFQEQLKSMIDMGNFDGIDDLEVTTESTERPVSYEKVMRDVKSTLTDSQFLDQVMSSNFQRILTVLER